MKQKQKDYLFESFCREAKYIPQLNKYVIDYKGNHLSSFDTSDLFKQYLKMHQQQETRKELK